VIIFELYLYTNTSMLKLQSKIVRGGKLVLTGGIQS